MNPIGQIAIFVAAASLVSGCTTVTYDGAPRPDSEVATITSERTLIATIDGKDVPYSGGNFATFKVLPGEHTIGVQLNDVDARRVSKKALPVVFSAEAGKSYVTGPVYNGPTWRPLVSERAVKNAPTAQK